MNGNPVPECPLLSTGPSEQSYKELALLNVYLGTGTQILTYCKSLKMIGLICKPCEVVYVQVFSKTSLLPGRFQCACNSSSPTTTCSWIIGFATPFLSVTQFNLPWQSRKRPWWGRWRATAPCRWTWRWRSRGRHGWRTTPSGSRPSAPRRLQTCHHHSARRTSTPLHDSAAQTKEEEELQLALVPTHSYIY